MSICDIYVYVCVQMACTYICVNAKFGLTLNPIYMCACVCVCLCVDIDICIDMCRSEYNYTSISI